MTDAAFMRRALALAERAVGQTTPNPVVGAVVVAEGGVVVGQGCHRRAGGPHAEVVALDEAGALARGSTLYVTLEPCSHQGRTGPCTRRIIEAGVARVVAAIGDPDPRVAGRGFEALRASGIAVDLGVLSTEATRLNAGFLTVQTLGRPLVVLKAATSLDARIAARPGARTALSSREANQRAQRLRASVDAVAVGSGTVLADDPLLTVRECHRERPLVRVVFDRRLRTPPTARLFSTLAAGPVIMVSGASRADAPAREGAGRDEVVDARERDEAGREHGTDARERDEQARDRETTARDRRADARERDEAGRDRTSTIEERRRALEGVGATVIESAGDLAGDLAQLVRWDIHTLLVEGGARLHAALWEAELVDRVHLCVTPTAIGAAGVPLFDGLPVPFSRMVPWRVEALGPDTWMEADVHWHR